MTPGSHTPAEKLKASIDGIVIVLKAVERGELVGHGKLAKARANKDVTFGIVADAGVFKVTIDWTVIAQLSDPDLSEYILWKIGALPIN